MPFLLHPVDSYALCLVLSPGSLSQQVVLDVALTYLLTWGMFYVTRSRLLSSFSSSFFFLLHLPSPFPSTPGATLSPSLLR